METRDLHVTRGSDHHFLLLSPSPSASGLEELRMRKQLQLGVYWTLSLVVRYNDSCPTASLFAKTSKQSPGPSARYAYVMWASARMETDGHDQCLSEAYQSSDLPARGGGRTPLPVIKCQSLSPFSSLWRVPPSPRRQMPEPLPSHLVVAVQSWE